MLEIYGVVSSCFCYYVYAVNLVAVILCLLLPHPSGCMCLFYADIVTFDYCAS